MFYLLIILIINNILIITLRIICVKYVFGQIIGEFTVALSAIHLIAFVHNIVKYLMSGKRSTGVKGERSEFTLLIPDIVLQY
jgi:hypothetical protein